MTAARRPADPAAARRAAAAERSRRHYERKRAGIRVVPVELDEADTLAALVARGLVTAEALRDPAQLGYELGVLLDELAKNFSHA